MTEPLPAGASWWSRSNLEAHRPCDLMLGMEGRETFALGRYRATGNREPLSEVVAYHPRTRRRRLLVANNSFDQIEGFEAMA